MTLVQCEPLNVWPTVQWVAQWSTVWPAGTGVPHSLVDLFPLVSLETDGGKVRQGAVQEEHFLGLVQSSHKAIVNPTWKAKGQIIILEGARESVYLRQVGLRRTHTHTHTDGQNDQSLNLLQCWLRSHLAEIINETQITTVLNEATTRRIPSRHVVRSTALHPGSAVANEQKTRTHGGLRR